MTRLLELNQPRHPEEPAKGFIPDAYIEGMAAFIARNNP